MDLIEQGFESEISIIDSAKGLIKGFEEVLPKAVIRHDYFQIIMDLKDCGKFLSNKEASAVTVALKLLKRADKARNEEKKQARMTAWNAALIDLNMREETCKMFKLLSSWMQYDVLQLAGLPPEARTELYDFIVTEMEGACSQASPSY